MFRQIGCTIGALFLGAALWAGESANYSRIKVWNDGDTLTASDLNAEINNILNNDNPAGGGSYSATLPHMRSTNNPYPGNVEVQATSLQDEITQLRFQILGLKSSIQASSTTYWYQGFPTPGVFTIAGSSVGVNQQSPAAALDVTGSENVTGTAVFGSTVTFSTMTTTLPALSIATNTAITGNLTVSGTFQPNTLTVASTVTFNGSTLIILNGASSANSADGANTPISNWTATYDRLSDMTVSTFTAPSTGKYLFTGLVNLQSTGSGILSASAWLALSTGSLAVKQGGYTTVSIPSSLAISLPLTNTLSLTAGQKIVTVFTCTNTGAAGCFEGAGTNMTIERLP